MLLDGMARLGVVPKHGHAARALPDLEVAAIQQPLGLHGRGDVVVTLDFLGRAMEVPIVAERVDSIKRVGAPLQGG
jgi:hypothetical protein